MAFDQGEAVVKRHSQIRVEAVADPSDTYVVDRIDSFNSERCRFDEVDRRRLDAVHQALEDLL